MARWGPTVRYNTTPIDFSGAVEGFMQARRDAQQAKRRKAMEERESDLFDLDMLDRGYSRTDPALLQQERDAGITAPMPGQVGGYRKTGLSRDERAGIAKVAEQERVRQEADARRGRARGTAQSLGFQGPESEFLADNDEALARELLAMRAAGRKPAPAPNFEKLQQGSGEFVFFDPVTQQRVNTGIVGRVPGSGTGGGGAKPKAPGLPTQAERTAAGLYEIGMNAIGTLETLQPPNQLQRFIGEMREAASGEGENLKAAALSFISSSNTQQFYDASTELAMAAQYALSGKAVTREEGRKLAARIIPAPGEGPKAVQQKLARRQEWIAAIKRMGGRAIPDEPRDEYDDEFDALDQRTP